MSETDQFKLTLHFGTRTMVVPDVSLTHVEAVVNGWHQAMDDGQATPAHVGSLPGRVLHIDLRQVHAIEADPA